MARARNIKPSFFDNDELAEIEPLGRLLFIGLWTLCDFRGNLEWRSKRIKKQLLAYDECSIDSLAINLDKSGFVRFYSDGDATYLNIVNFAKHQNPHKNEKAKGSEIPEYSEDMRQAVDFNGLTINHDKSRLIRNNSESNPADSLLLIPDSLNLIPEDIDQKISNSEIIESEFEEFWESGTHKNKPLQCGLKRVGKNQAKKSFIAQFKKLPKDFSYTNPDGEIFFGERAFSMMLIDDIAKRCASGQFGFEGSLHPTTYLNNQRWNDEYETSRPSNQQDQYRGISDSKRAILQARAQRDAANPDSGFTLGENGRSLLE